VPVAPVINILELAFATVSICDFKCSTEDEIPNKKPSSFKEDVEDNFLFSSLSFLS
jgi:hypothetical protein